MEYDVKNKVKKYYGGIAKKVNSGMGNNCCLTSSCCSGLSRSSLIYGRENLNELPKEAVEASLGCANPLLFAGLKNGETVLDLGSGGGIDVLMSSRYVGPTGKVYGLDMTDEMLELANKNKEKMGATNVEFLKGLIEDIPLQNEIVDIIMSNCVINLCESKEKALSEAYRVLKKGGRLAIADIVVLKHVPESIRHSVEMWVGCIAGALSVKKYEEILKKVGFKDIKITPVNIYTRDVIEDIAKQKNSGDAYSKIDAALIDGAFAGAHVKAYKF
ncbi:arsenite methyltransferase [Clostridium sp. HV4-5-A1G]|uniref:arsenite methyltransferase n=1 Tax=Clostridium sp. HV4-5-A1G TaxID=2004595 RepID=UPI00123A5C69|nr:arsenite methyltransferase [Clostridium sp. HV4-5-A1G]KAA8674649.1 arsenite methyltransferase [Clostridium sp. HV4-5-A1G]CAB1246088.1 Arsenite methyltransferase [Clostridiaceae bacterium BL-3]